MSTSIGERIRRLRVKENLTQDDVATRTGISKALLSQIERDQISPPVDTLAGILEYLGSGLSEFFKEGSVSRVVFREADMPVESDEELGYHLRRLIPNAKKALEPILLSLEPGGTSRVYEPFEGEECGYVLMGSITVNIGSEAFKVRKGESFHITPGMSHFLSNTGRNTAKVIWIFTPSPT